MRYSFAPIDAHRRIDITELARRVGVSPRTVHRWRHEGLSEENADRCAAALDLVAYEVWPEMVDHHAQKFERACETCGATFVLTRSDKRFCNRACKNAHPDAVAYRIEQARRRYQADEEYRERVKRQRRERYEQDSRVERLKQRIRYQQQRERWHD